MQSQGEQRGTGYFFVRVESGCTHVTRRRVLQQATKSTEARKCTRSLFGLPNPLNRPNPNNPFNPITKYDPDNSLNPINRYDPNTSFRPLRLAKLSQAMTFSFFALTPSPRTS